MIGWSGHIWAELGKTGRDLEHGTFYPGGEKERILSYLGMCSFFFMPGCNRA